MKVIIFGATGMIGSGVLRECLLDDSVEAILSVGRRSGGRADVKLRELLLADVADLSPVEAQLTGFDACFFCLGVPSAGMKEAEYRRLTHDLTLSVARTLARLNPSMTFVYVSGAGTDSSVSGRSMWARVKGQTENDLFQLPFKSAYMFRPGIVRALHGIRPRSRLYRTMYLVLTPIVLLLAVLLPERVTTTELVGRAMIRVAERHPRVRILPTRAINELAA